MMAPASLSLATMVASRGAMSSWPGCANPSQPAVVTSPEVASVPPALPKPDVFVQAGQLFSETVLSDPRSRRAREVLRGLAGGERNLQLCDLEALEQVRRARPEMHPDALAPYAMSAEKVSGNSVEVKGGAFRSRGKWYR